MAHCGIGSMPPKMTSAGFTLGSLWGFLAHPMISVFIFLRSLLARLDNCQTVVVKTCYFETHLSILSQRNLCIISNVFCSLYGKTGSWLCLPVVTDATNKLILFDKTGLFMFYMSWSANSWTCYINCSISLLVLAHLQDLPVGLSYKTTDNVNKIKLVSLLGYFIITNTN